MASRTLLELLVWASERSPDRPALLFEDGVMLSRRDLRDLTERFAATLQQWVSPGDRVALVMDNRAEFMVAYFAVLANRAAVVPLNPASGPTDAAHVLRGSGARVVVADTPGAELVERLRGELPALQTVIVVSGPEPDGLPTGQARVSLASVAARPEDLIGITFTSGTTGLPKGCMVDHAWALRVTDLALRIHPYEPGDRIFYPVKFHYLDGLLALLRALQCDGSYVAVRRFSVSRFWDIVRAQRVSIISTIASMPVWLLKAEPNPADRDHAVRFAIQALIPPELHAEMDRRWGFPWLENYGMQEAGLIARVPLVLADELRGSGSAGPPAPEVEVRILDDDDQPLPPQAVGEIVVRQPGMFRGYLDDPASTAAILRHGWLHTGDLGRVDERGFVYVVGRKKDVIRRSGENVSAVEVETVLRRHPRIVDAAVIGVPDQDRGEELKAYIQLAEGVSAGELPAAEVVAFCAARLASHKVPRYLEYLDELPRTPSMRVRKELLRARGEILAHAWDRERDH